MKLRKVHFRPDIGPKRDQFFPSLTGPQAQRFRAARVSKRSFRILAPELAMGKAR
jgi:hypothetical protein